MEGTELAEMVVVSTSIRLCSNQWKFIESLSNLVSSIQSKLLLFVPK